MDEDGGWLDIIDQRLPLTEELTTDGLDPASVVAVESGVGKAKLATEALRGVK